MAQVVQRAALIVALGVILGLVSNAVVPKSIPLITPPKKAHQPEEYIPLQKAHELWGGGAAVFLDARKPADFEAGHIAQALNLPQEEFEEYFPKLAPMLAPDSPAIVYCDGTECELSHRLADQLKQQGFTDIHILFNGWTAWREAGFPVETGAAL